MAQRARRDTEILQNGKYARDYCSNARDCDDRVLHVFPPRYRRDLS